MGNKLSTAAPTKNRKESMISVPDHLFEEKEESSSRALTTKKVNPNEDSEEEELEDLYNVDNLRMSEWTYQSGSASDKLTCVLCFETKAIKSFRVPKCGHYVCYDCFHDYLMCSHDGCQRVCVYCQAPLKGNVNVKFSAEDLHALPDPDKFLRDGGKLVNLEPETSELPPNDLHQLVREHFRYRVRTIKKLRAAADILEKVTKNTAIANLSGASASMVGTILFITGGLISLSGVGSVVGVPLAISGAAIGGAGSLTVVGSELVKYLKRNRKLKVVNEHLRKDYFKTTRVRVRYLQLQKYDYSETLSPRDKLKYQLYGGVNTFRAAALAGSSAVMLSSTGKVGAIAARTAAYSGSVVAGVAFSAIMIPLDLFVMIESSIQIHKKTIPQICNQIRELATMLEKDLFSVRNTLMKELIQFKNNVLNELSDTTTTTITTNNNNNSSSIKNNEEEEEKYSDHNSQDSTTVQVNTHSNALKKTQEPRRSVHWDDMDDETKENEGNSVPTHMSLNRALDPSVVMINLDDNRNIHTIENTKNAYAPTAPPAPLAPPLNDGSSFDRSIFEVVDNNPKTAYARSNTPPIIQDVYELDDFQRDEESTSVEVEDPELIALREPMMPEGYDKDVWDSLPIEVRQEMATEALLTLLQQL